MVAAPKGRPATRRDLEALADNVIGEILAGELHVSPRPASRHALAASALGSDVFGRFHRPPSGDSGGWWILDEPELELGDDTVVPDLAGWRRERMPVLPDAATFTLAPDWVCEVLSPSTARIDRILKLPIYLRAGVSRLWLVDPIAQSLEALRRTDDGWLLVGTWGGDMKVRVPPFDAAEIDLARLWDRGERSST